MKVEYFGRDGNWWWSVGGKAMSVGFYSRRRDAVRGYERFCAAIKGVK